MEFQEVMKQWRRFCKSHNNCGECEFDGRGICGEAHLSDVPYSDTEMRIMAWAAEHPEPVYPTWGEWLLEQGVLVADGAHSSMKYWYAVNHPKIMSRIPADIAQKLRIEPKEG